MSLHFSKFGSQLKRQFLSQPGILRTKKKKQEFCTRKPPVGVWTGWGLFHIRKRAHPEPEWRLTVPRPKAASVCQPTSAPYTWLCHFCTPQSSGRKSGIGTLNPCGYTQEAVYMCLRVLFLREGRICVRRQYANSVFQLRVKKQNIWSKK